MPILPILAILASGSISSHLISSHHYYFHDSHDSHLCCSCTRSSLVLVRFVFLFLTPGSWPLVLALGLGLGLGLTTSFCLPLLLLLQSSWLLVPLQFTSVFTLFSPISPTQFYMHTYYDHPTLLKTLGLISCFPRDHCPKVGSRSSKG